jgi:HSP20 family protein
MANFFEKLKKGMAINGEIEEIKEEETKEEDKKEKEELEKELKEVENKEKAPKEKSKKKESPDFKKIEIEVTPLKNIVSNGIKPKESEEKKEFKEKTAEEKKEKWFGKEGQLMVDVYKTDGFLVIQSAIAGVKGGDLDISIENDMVMIKGIREKTDEEEKKDYLCQECYWGPFSRKIILPEEVDPSRAEAKMKEGILTIKIPIIERQKKRKILIKE